MHKKFIIYDGDVRLGHVDFHKELGPDKSLIKGGGWWHYDKENDVIYLYSSSMDFGRVTRENLIDAIHNGLRSRSREGTQFFHSFNDFLDIALVDPVGIWIEVPQKN
jgi:hypothetical protein